MIVILTNHRKYPLVSIKLDIKVENRVDIHPYGSVKLLL